MRYLDANGNIAEIISTNFGKKPSKNSLREKKLLKWGWLWLLIPIMGFIPYFEVRRELTDKWGHEPWWL